MQQAGRLLSILSGGKSVAKTRLLELLVLTEAGLAEAVGYLASRGVDLAVQNDCYSLELSFDLLAKNSITDVLAEHARQRLGALYVEAFVDSTNALAMDGARQHDDMAVWCAEYQSAGRGRRGRQWVSPFASNIYLSLLWRFKGRAEELSALSLAVGVVLAQYFEELGVQSVGLKWPNDVVIGGRKLGGILIELQTLPGGAVAVVIGIGINVAMRHEEAVSIDQPWTDLNSLLDKPCSRSLLVGGIVNQLIAMLEQFEDEGFAAFRDQWAHFDVCNGESVSLLGSSAPITGIARGVASDGALILEHDGARHHYHGGEVSLRVST